MSIKTMKQALDALNTCDYDYDYEESMYKTYDSKLIDLAIEALSQAIAEAEKEVTLQEISDIGQWDTSDMAHRAGGLSVDMSTKPQNVYTSAERVQEIDKSIHEDDDIQEYKKPWVGLTDEEITEYSSWLSGRNVVRAIEQRLKEKNT